MREYRQPKNQGNDEIIAWANIPIGDTFDTVLNKAIVKAFADSFKYDFYLDPNRISPQFKMSFQMHRGLFYKAIKYELEQWQGLDKLQRQKAKARLIDKAVLEIARSLWADGEKIFTLKHSWKARLKFLFRPNV
jgi:hypothetical protein